MLIIYKFIKEELANSNMVGNEKGFTLIEIIVVLVILGILATVALPKYNDMQGQAKTMAAQAQVAEIKGTLNMGWGKALLANGGTSGISGSEVIGNAGLAGVVTMGTAPDIWNVMVAVGAGGNAVNVTVSGRNSDTAYAANGVWHLPQ